MKTLNAPAQTIFSAPPWRTVPTTSRPGGQRLDIVTDSLAFSPSFVAGDIMPDDAAFIIRACNSHAALVAALQDLIAADTVSGPEYSTTRNKARAALAKAKEGL